MKFAAALAALACVPARGQDAKDTKSYRDPGHKYSLSYPGSLTFEMKEDKSGWFVFIHRRDTPVPFNPNLNLVIESVPAATQCDSSLDYAKLAMKNLEEEFLKAKPRFALEPLETEVNGKTFCKVLYGAVFNKMDLLILQYCYFDPESRNAFVFTALDLSKHDLLHVAQLEKVIRTVKFD